MITEKRDQREEQRRARCGRGMGRRLIEGQREREKSDFGVNEERGGEGARREREDYPRQKKSNVTKERERYRKNQDGTYQCYR